MQAPSGEEEFHKLIENSRQTTAILFVSAAVSLVVVLLWDTAAVIGAALNIKISPWQYHIALGLPIVLALLSLSVVIVRLLFTKVAATWFSQFSLLAVTLSVAMPIFFLQAYEPPVLLAGALCLGLVIFAAILFRLRGEQRVDFTAQPDEISTITLSLVVVPTALLALLGIGGFLFFQIMPYVWFFEDPAGWLELYTSEYSPTEWGILSTTASGGEFGVIWIIASAVLVILALASSTVLIYFGGLLRSRLRKSNPDSSMRATQKSKRFGISGWILLGLAALSLWHLVAYFMGRALWSEIYFTALPNEFFLISNLQLVFFLATFLTTALIRKNARSHHQTSWWWLLAIWLMMPLVVSFVLYTLK